MKDIKEQEKQKNTSVFRFTNQCCGARYVCRVFFFQFQFHYLHNTTFAIGPAHDLVTWYRIEHAGEHVSQWDFQNNASSTCPPRSAFVLHGSPTAQLAHQYV